ncbi:MAG: ATP-binding protein, partial [Firmicutes bacterium]|nr:ATP-binding protein [Bacillota bacterium]
MGYDSSKIQVLEGLNAVRMRPGMYIGGTGVKGMHHLLWEIVDNSIDEVANGHGNKIDIKLFKDGSISVQDNGRGIPVDMHKDLKISGVEVVFTQLHAGGKFSGENYSYSGGLHGVGASVTNALSEWCEVTVYKGGKTYFVRFSPQPHKDDPSKIMYGAAEAPLKQIPRQKDDPQTGTHVKFFPARDMFKNCEFSNDTINRRLKELAFLNKGIEITFQDFREEVSSNNYITEYKYDGGLSDFALYLNENKTALYQEPFLIEGTATGGTYVALAIQHTDSYAESIFSYVNNIPTSEGGTHETGFKMAITRAFNQIAKANGFLKEKENTLMGEDYREGMTAVLAIKMREVQFEGQTKTKLGNPEAKTDVEGFVFAELMNFFSDLGKDKLKWTLFELIMNKAKGAARVREAARRAKDIARQKNSLDGGVLIGKLASCTGRRPELNELFIVEGDSAGGTAKQARDRSIQAILPLKGKPLNAEKKRLDQVLDNDEFRTIISALGTSIGEDFTLDNLKYHKVVILADADQDGAHIRAILLTFFFRYMKELITEGHIYIGMPPLYKLSSKSFTGYAYDDAELKI